LTTGKNIEAALLHSSDEQPFPSRGEAARNVTATIKAVAQRLRNTPAVCRKSYVHPAIVEAYHDGMLDQPAEVARRRGLRVDEVRHLQFLRVGLNQRS